MATREVVLKLKLKAIDAAPLKNLGAEAKKAGAQIDKSLNQPLPAKLGKPLTVLPQTRTPTTPLPIQPSTLPQVKAPGAVPASSGGVAQAAGGLLEQMGLGGAGKLLGKAGGLLGGGAGGGLAGAGAAGGGALAAAGPVGLAIGAAMALTPVVKKLASAPFQAVIGGMAGVNKALAGLTGSLGPIGSALGIFEGVGSSMKSMGDALGPLGIGMSVMGGAIEGVTKQVTAFLNTAIALTNKAQPGKVKQFQMAVDDAAAVVGHRLAPLIELMTKVTRGLADAMNTVLPSTSSVRDALAPLSEAWDAIKEALLPVAHIIKIDLAVGLKIVALHLRGLAVGLKVLLFPLRALGQLLGLKWKDSTGAAARQAKFQDPESAAKELYQAIFANQGRDPSEETAENTAGILDNIIGLADKIKDAILSGIETLADRLFSAFPDLAAKVVDFKMPDFGGVLDSLKDKLSDLKLPDFPNPFADWKNPFTDWKNPFPEWKNPFAEWKNPFLEWKNPFADWKLPEFKAPEIKLPDFKLPQVPLPAPAGGNGKSSPAAEAIKAWILPGGGRWF